MSLSCADTIERLGTEFGTSIKAHWCVVLVMYDFPLAFIAKAAELWGTSQRICM